MGLILSSFVVEEYFGIDPDESQIEFSKKNFSGKNSQYKLGKAEEIPFDRKFDILLYTFSWHFIGDFKKAIEEAKRVLREGGIIAILEPCEDTKTWGSDTLRKESSEFSQEAYDSKMKSLKKARDEIYKQKIFEIVSEEKGDETKPNMWILK